MKTLKINVSRQLLVNSFKTAYQYPICSLSKLSIAQKICQLSTAKLFSFISNASREFTMGPLWAVH